MKTGFDAVKAAIESSRESSQSGKFLPYFIWKDDKQSGGTEYSKTIRFLTDEVVPVMIYEYIPCRDGKKRDFVVPSSIAASGPDIVQESGVLVQQYGNQSNLIKPKPRSLTLGVAVLREEVPKMVDGRRVLQCVDKLEEVTYSRDGEEITENRQVIGLVKQSNTNFWSTVAGYYARYGTICDRDYNIERSGNGIRTVYTVIPCDIDESLIDKEELDKRYEAPVDLHEYVEELASVSRARKYLLGEGLEEDEDSSFSQEKTSSVEADKDSEFSSLRSQLLGH